MVTLHEFACHPCAQRGPCVATFWNELEQFETNWRNWNKLEQCSKFWNTGHVTHTNLRPFAHYLFDYFVLIKLNHAQTESAG